MYGFVYALIFICSCVCVYSLYNDGADYDNVYTWELCVRKRS